MKKRKRLVEKACVFGFSRVCVNWGYCCFFFVFFLLFLFVWEYIIVILDYFNVNSEMCRDVCTSWMNSHESEFKAADGDDIYSQSVCHQWKDTEVKKLLSERGGKDSKLCFCEFLHIMLDNQDIHQSFVMDTISTTPSLKDLEALVHKPKELLRLLESTCQILHDD